MVRKTLVEVLERGIRDGEKGSRRLDGVLRGGGRREGDEWVVQGFKEDGEMKGFEQVSRKAKGKRKNNKVVSNVGIRKKVSHEMEEDEKTSLKKEKETAVLMLRSMWEEIVVVCQGVLEEVRKGRDLG